VIQAFKNTAAAAAATAGQVSLLVQHALGVLLPCKWLLRGPPDKWHHIVADVHALAAASTMLHTYVRSEHA
jgi:hypothetical protein